MNKALQPFLVLLAILGVGALGYYAYSIATDTYSMPFVGQERQSGNNLQLAVSKPWITIGNIDPTLDRSALEKSLIKNGTPWSVVSGEASIMMNAENISIAINGTPKKGDTFTLSSKLYNENKKTGWRLPRDISTTIKSQNEYSNMNISRTGRPGDMMFKVMMEGFEGVKLSDIRWYIRENTTDMLPSNLNLPTVNTLPYRTNCSLWDWDSTHWKKLSVTEIEGYSNSDGGTGIYKLNLSSYPSGACIVVGVGGRFSFMSMENLRDFTASGTISDMLSPEYNMKSRVDFKFSTDIYADSGALYSPQYIENRRLAKVNFLKHLNISDGVEVTEDMLELKPNQATLYLDLKEGRSYTLKLNNIQDIYGRKTSTEIEVTPVSTPYLSLRLDGNKTIWRDGDNITAKIFHIKTPKQEYEVKLCKATLEGYSRMERINEIASKDFINASYDLLSSTDVSGCVKKTVALSQNEYISGFDLASIYPTKLTPGLYILALRNKEDVSVFDRYIATLPFSIIDTNITMKVDSSGKMNFLATDIKTGIPRANQTITLQSNIGKIYNTKWNTSTQQYNYEYLPLSTRSFGTGITVGTTRGDGVLNTDAIKLKGEYDEQPYGLMDEWKDPSGRYYSFLASATGEGHFGYVVSTWNDGITGWNFGLKESDYTWVSRPNYSVYSHTERKLYLPGETVYYKAIIRKNDTAISIPEGETFEIKVTDSAGKDIYTTRVKANEFGSIATNFVLGKDVTLGYYNISLVSVDRPNEYFGNGYTNFQVEVFKNPTFTAEVKLSSPQVENNVIKNLREEHNTNIQYSWYKNVYTSKFTLQGVVTAHYYNGAKMKSIPFTYRIYKNRYYDSSYWNDCFWGCYYEGSPEFYSEGTGTIDSDGVGMIRADVEFSSYSNDYNYTIEVTLTDPLSAENVTTPGTLLVKLPAEYRLADSDNPIEGNITKRLLSPGETLNITVKPKYGKWDQSLSGKYQYNLIRRIYTNEAVNSIRDNSSPITHSQDEVVKSDTIKENTINIDTHGYTPGEYLLRISPVVDNGTQLPPSSITENIVYITGDFQNKSSKLTIVPEKTVYHEGETARLMITTPYMSGGYIYLTRERGGVLDYEYIRLDGNTYTREYKIDESFYPNVYIGAVAFPKDGANTPLYAVGYGEIVMDLTDKKANLIITPNADTYKNRDTVQLDISLSDFRGQPKVGEVEVMVVDESLIRLLGNIDLDVIPKFFQKYPFTMKTALSLIGLERNRFLSRLGSNGGSGDKGGDGVQISSRTLFKNTAYYNASIITDKNGKAKVSFQLPDNVTDYRIMGIAQTKTSQFGVSEKVIAVRRDYTLEAHAPYISYGGDSTTITASAFNNTTKVTPITLTVTVGSGTNVVQRSEDLILNPTENASRSFSIPVSKDWFGEIPYTITMKEGKNTLDSIQKTFRVPNIPKLSDIKRLYGSTTKPITLTLPKIGPNTSADSPITISVSTSPLQNAEKIIKSMIQYPYGCIEQTISSTMPNAIALQMGKDLGIVIDEKSAKKNLDEGIAKILRMQDPLSGGWKYWEGDSSANPYVTPYVVRNLYDFKNLGVAIPDDVIQRGLDYMVNFPMASYGDNISNAQAEVFATLAKAKDPRANNFISTINTNVLNRHGYLMYHIGLKYLGKLDGAQLVNLRNRMNSRDTDYYWYWSDNADYAIYARLLYSLGGEYREEGVKIITDILKDGNLEGYYMSTQEKMQVFITLIEMSKGSSGLSGLKIESTDKLIPVPTTPTSRYTYTTKRSDLGETLTLSQSGTLYYEILLEDRPIDIYKVDPESHPDISVERIFEKVDESKGLDENGQFIATTPMNDLTFKKGELYRVGINVQVKNLTKPKYYLALEDYLPGGWRPIRGIFKTESKATSDGQDGYWYWNGWDHVEALDTQILATRDVLYPPYNTFQASKPYTYTYYIRPEYSGTYLLPPVNAYYMYQPEIHAFGKYQKVIVE